jgi:sterol 3beta-glucosyltransferase
MRLVALTYGTEGDARPIAALSRALMDTGYEVILLADGGTLSSARHLGVPHAALAGDIRGTLQSVSSTSSVVAGKNSLNATAQALARIANENADAWMRHVLDAAAGSDGLIVAGLAAFIGFSAAEKLGIPVIGAGMIPLTPTSAFPSPFLPPRSMPRWLNRFSYRLVSELLWRAFRKATNAARSKVGLPSGHKIWFGHPMLYGISPSLLPQPADWPNNAWMCGQWICPAHNWEAPRSLESFLSAGDAPIYVGFGSMVGFDPHALLDAVIAAVDGQRALFFLSGLEWRGFAETANEFLHHWRHPARLAVPSRVPGHSSRRVRDDAFRSLCGRTFGRSAFRSRSVLLGRAVTPARHSAGYGERPQRYAPHLVSCNRRRSNGRDAGASFGRRRKDARGKRPGNGCRASSCSDGKLTG